MTHPMAWDNSRNQEFANAYLYGGLKKVQELFPNRSKYAIWTRASDLGIHIRRPWSEKDDRILKFGWGPLSLKTIAKNLNRTECSIRFRAERLGVQMGCPNGFEYVSNAAKRLGFNRSSFRRVLAWANVLDRPAMCQSRTESGATIRRIVDSFDAERAVESWLKTETVNGAAKARGVPETTLSKWLREAGALTGRVPMGRVKNKNYKRPHYRVATEIIDKVVLERSVESKQ